MFQVLEPGRWCARLDLQLASQCVLAARRRRTRRRPRHRRGRRSRQALAHRCSTKRRCCCTRIRSTTRAKRAANRRSTACGSGAPVRAPRVPASHWQSVSADDPVALGLARRSGARDARCGSDADAWLRDAPRGRPPSRPARCAARAARAGPERRVRGVHRRAGKALVRAAPRRTARESRRHGDAPCPDAAECASYETIRGDLRRFWRRPKALEKLRVKIVARAYDESDRHALVEAGVHPLLARIYAARRIRSSAELDIRARPRLLSPIASERHRRTRPAARRRHRRGQAPAHRRRLRRRRRHRLRGRHARAACLRRARRTTSCPTASSSATASRRRSSSSPRSARPDLLITVDNGIASVDGVARARAARHRHARSPTTTCPGAELPARRVHRQSEPARLRLSVARTSPASA